MKDLTQEDFDLARKLVDDIVDNTDILEIRNKISISKKKYYKNKDGKWVEIE